jgi:TonB family protein
VATLETVDGAGVRETPVATSVAGDAGQFEFQALVPGQYSLKAELPGFATYRKPWIDIESSRRTRENVMLTVGNLVERVQVSSVRQGNAPPAVPSPRRIRVGGNVQAANLLTQVRPIYPPSAREAGIEGTVYLQGIIGLDGSFAALRVVGSSEPSLASAALEAARQWRYRPTLLNGEPIEVQTEIQIEFKLAQ